MHYCTLSTKYTAAVAKAQVQQQRLSWTIIRRVLLGMLLNMEVKMRAHDGLWQGWSSAF